MAKRMSRMQGLERRPGTKNSKPERAGSKSYRVFSRLERAISWTSRMLLAVSKPLNTHMNFDLTVSYLFEKCHMPKNSKVNAGFYKLLISNQF
jgi:hypothetical protein